jgi:Bacterial Ig-like domain (group 2)/Immunoglobulin domain
MKSKYIQAVRPEKSQANQRRKLHLSWWSGFFPLSAVALASFLGLAHGQEVSLVLSNDPALKVPYFLATDGTNLLVSGVGTNNNQYIFEVPPSGGAASIVYNAVNPQEIAVLGPNLFWIDPNSGPVTDTQILKAPDSGNGSVTAIYTGSLVGQPILDGSGMASDGSFLYAADEVAGTVWRLNPDGSALTQIGPSRYTGGFSPEHLNTLAINSGILYVADQGKPSLGISPAVLSIPTNGSSFTSLVAGAPLVSPSSITVGGSKIYIADPGANNTIWQLPLGGGTPTALVSGGVFKQIQGLCFLNGNLYVADSAAGAIYRITLTQPEFQTATYLGAAGADLIGTGIKCYGGSVYVCADSSDSSGLLACYKTPLAAGALPVWNNMWPDSNPSDQFHGITASSSGIYVAGPDYTRTTDTVGGKEAKGLMLKYPFSGATGSGYGGDIWDQQTPVPPGAFSYGGGEGLNAVTLANENGTNYVYTTGSGQSGFSNGGRLFVSKLAEDSTVLWTQTDGAEQVGEAYSSANAVVGLHTNIHMAGLNYDDNASGQPYLRKYSSSGSLVWVRRDNIVGAYQAITSIGNYLYAVGYTGQNAGPTANLNFLIEKWDENGNQIWSQTYSRSAQSLLTGVVGVGSRLFAVGYSYGGTAGGSDAVIMEFDPAVGELLNTNLYGGNLDDMAMAVDTDGTDLYVAGATRSFGNGSNQVMVLRYSIGPALATISVTPANPIIGTGTNLQFIATGYYNDGSTQPLTNAGQVTWTSSSPGVASINANGLAAGLTLGTSTISVSSAGVDGNTLLTVVVKPTISTDPVNITSSPGGTTTLSVNASGGDLSYQWQLNGTNVPGATSSSLTLTDINLNQAGNYQVIVSNAAGSTTSSTAVLSLLSINMYAGLTIEGEIGATYEIDYENSLSNSNWMTLTNIVLPASPYFYVDTTSPFSSTRFYRAIK